MKSMNKWYLGDNKQKNINILSLVLQNFYVLKSSSQIWQELSFQWNLTAFVIQGKHFTLYFSKISSCTKLWYFSHRLNENFPYVQLMYELSVRAPKRAFQIYVIKVSIGIPHIKYSHM